MARTATAVEYTLSPTELRDYTTKLYTAPGVSVTLVVYA